MGRRPAREQPRVLGDSRPRGHGAWAQQAQTAHVRVGRGQCCCFARFSVDGSGMMRFVPLGSLVSCSFVRWCVGALVSASTPSASCMYRSGLGRLVYCYNEVNSPLPPRLVNTREGLPNTLACVSYESPSTTWTRQRDGLDAERYQRCLDETTSFHDPLAGTSRFLTTTYVGNWQRVVPLPVRIIK